MYPLVDDKDNETGDFSFFWTIENFKLLLLEDFLYSPCFKVETAGKIDIFKLVIKFDYNLPYGECRLACESGSQTQNHALSVSFGDGSFKRNSKRSNVLKFAIFDFTKKEYLVNNALTIRCRIWEEDSDLSTRISCHARTVIGVEKIVYFWTLKDFEACETDVKEVKLKSPSNAETSFTIELLSKRDDFSDVSYYFKIRKNSIGQEFLTTICEVFLLDSNKDSTFSVRDGLTFKIPWEIPFIQKSELLGNKEKFLPNGDLNLRIEIVFATGCNSSYIERTEYSMVEKNLSPGQEVELQHLLVNQVTQHVCKEVAKWYSY